jgi:hypothetical protein
VECVAHTPRGIGRVHRQERGPRLALKQVSTFLQDVSTFCQRGGANPKEGVSFLEWSVFECVGHTLCDVGGLGGAHLMREGPTTSL